MASPAAADSSSPPAALQHPPQSLYDALKHESVCVLHKIAAPLKEALSIDLLEPFGRHGRASSLAQLKVTIVYGPNSRSSELSRHRRDLVRPTDPTGTPRERMTELLTALATLLRHSFLLNAYPELKVGFWLQVLQLRRLHPGWDEPTIQSIHPSLIEAKAFPCVAMELYCLEFDADWSDALVDFLTLEPARSGTSAQLDALSVQQRIPLRLCTDAYDRVPLKVVSLLHKVLERSSRHTSRPFLIEELAFRNHLSSADLRVLIQIVGKGKEYGLQRVSVNDCSERDESDERESMVHTLLREGLQITELLVQQNGIRQKVGGQVSLKRFTFDGSTLRARRVAVICSALRYGCAVEKLVLSQSGGRWSDTAPENQREYWQWMAFGLFYPRSKRFGGSSKLRVLELYLPNVIKLAYITAFENALLNPAKQLAGYVNVDNQPAKELLWYWERDRVGSAVRRRRLGM